MGAFFLVKKNKEYNSDAVLKTFKKRGFDTPSKFDLGDFDLFLYKKILTTSHNHVNDGQNIICGVGTFLYKDHPTSETLTYLLKDILAEKFDRNQLRGNYAIICHVKGQMLIIKDPENLYNIFHSNDYQIISSSFLSIINSSNKNLNLNKIVVTELLVTGFIIGSDTIFKEILRFEKHNVSNFKDIKWICELPNAVTKYPTNYSTAVNKQIEILNEYFKKISTNFKNTNCFLGVTGGFDSRLLIGLVKKHFKTPLYFSHFRKKIDGELTIAKKIAKKLNVDLFSPKVSTPTDMTEKELLEQLERAMLFLDGQIRASTFWTETYNTLDYFKNFQPNSILTFNGIGGEQYRNGERILFNEKDIANWYYCETSYKYTGELFSNETQKKTFLKYLNSKIDIVFPNSSKISFSRQEIKKFLNEIYNPAGRCLRLSTENQAYFVLAPFTDYIVSHNAYHISKHLGLSNKFEIDIIKKVSPELSDIPTSYGYSINKGETYKSRLLTIIKESLPNKLYYNLLYKRKKIDQTITNLYKEHTKIEEYFISLKKLNLQIDLNKLKNSAAHSPHLIALGFFLDHFSERINYD